MDPNGFSSFNPNMMSNSNMNMYMMQPNKVMVNPGQGPMLGNPQPLGYTQQNLLPTGKRMYEGEGNIPYGFLLEHAKRQRMEYYKALFYIIPDQIRWKILAYLPIGELFASSTVGVEWHKDVELTLRMLCIRDFKLAWAPRMEQDILRSYTSWADVYRQKEKFWRLVQVINADEKRERDELQIKLEGQQGAANASANAASVGWVTDQHSMPFVLLPYQYIWNDAFYIIWNEVLNYSIPNRKPKMYEYVPDECVICRTESDVSDLILCDGCPVMYHLSCIGLANAPEGSFFCASCRDLSQPSSVKTPWYLSNFIKYQEVVDTTYTSEEEDDNEYQSSESGEIDIEEPDNIPIPEESSESEDYAAGETSQDEDTEVKRESSKPRKKKKRMNEQFKHGPGNMMSQNMFGGNAMNRGMGNVGGVGTGMGPFPGMAGQGPNFGAGFGGMMSANPMMMSQNMFNPLGSVPNGMSFFNPSNPGLNNNFNPNANPSGNNTNNNSQASNNSGPGDNAGPMMSNSMPFQPAMLPTTIPGLFMPLSPQQQQQLVSLPLPADHSQQAAPQNQLAVESNQSQQRTSDVPQGQAQPLSHLDQHEAIADDAHSVPNVASTAANDSTISEHETGMIEDVKLESEEIKQELNPASPSRATHSNKRERSLVEGDDTMIVDERLLNLPNNNSGKLSEKSGLEGNNSSDGHSFDMMSRQPPAQQSFPPLSFQFSPLDNKGPMQQNQFNPGASQVKFDAYHHSDVPNQTNAANLNNASELSAPNVSNLPAHNSMMFNPPSHLPHFASSPHAPQQSQAHHGQQANQFMPQFPPPPFPNQPLYSPFPSSGMGGPSQRHGLMPQGMMGQPRGFSHVPMHMYNRPMPKKERVKRNKIQRALCFPFSREIKMMALKKFDTDQVAEVLCYSIGVPLEEDELIRLDKNPLGRPDVSKPHLQQVFEVIFRMWNKDYCRLSYFPRAQCDTTCGAIWIGKSIESVLFADVTEPNIPKAVFVYPRRKPYIMSSQPVQNEHSNRKSFV